LLALDQVGADRILKFTFDSKHGIRMLFVEMFQNGNVLLTDEDELILQALTSTSYADRVLKKGHQYLTPPPPVEPRSLSIDEFTTLMVESDQPLGRTLGGKFNLGSTLSDTICFKCQYDPSTAISDVDPQVVYDVLQAQLGHCSCKECRNIRCIYCKTVTSRTSEVTIVDRTSSALV
ncbi:MAG: NFACT family protein, partial [Candidatus Poseidoniales archaeon]